MSLAMPKRKKGRMDIGGQSQEGRKLLLEFALLIDYFRLKTTSLRKLPAKHRGRKRVKNGARTTEVAYTQ